MFKSTRSGIIAVLCAWPSYQGYFKHLNWDREQKILFPSVFFLMLSVLNNLNTVQPSVVSSSQTNYVAEAQVALPSEILAQVVAGRKNTVGKIPSSIQEYITSLRPSESQNQ